MDARDILFQTAPFGERFGEWVKSDQVLAWKDALNDPAVFVPLGAVCACVIAIIGLFVWERGGKGKTKVMGKLQISRKRGIHIGDRITDIVEDLRYRDLITKQEKLMIYRFFSDAAGLKDLVPQHQKEVKNRVRKRLGNGEYKTKAAIPGGQPLTMEEISESRPKPQKRLKARHSGLLAIEG